MNGHVTGVGWRETDLSFEVRRDLEDKELIPIAVGDSISFAITQARKCIGYRPPEANSLIPCPQSADSKGSSQCAACFEAALILPCLRCDGDRCRNPERRHSCVQPDNHALYLASFAPGVIKVGVARWQRRFERLAEQGARSALICAQDDGQIIRRYESQIRKFGYPDRLQTSEKLRLLTIAATEEELLEELHEALETIKPRMRAAWVSPPEVMRMPEQPYFKQAPRMLDPERGLTLKGTVHAISGQTLIIYSDSNETVALEGSALTGYILEELKEGQGSSGQLSLALA